MDPDLWSGPNLGLSRIILPNPAFLPLSKICTVQFLQFSYLKLD